MKLRFMVSVTIYFFLLVFQAVAQSNSPPEIVSHSAVVMDATTGIVVFSKNSDDEIPPASLTKLMTMHLVFKEIAGGKAFLDEVISPPKESWAVNQLPLSSVMNLANGQSLSLRELLLGLAIPSGNDAAAALALRFAPSINDFVYMMNREASALGLAQTRFVDASGYSEDNMTTAREFAEFCRVYLESNPKSIYDYHSVREFFYPLSENVAEQYRENPGTRRNVNRNNLLGRVEGVDGLKTGFIFESGYNIALTAARNGTRFIAVILGGPSGWGGDRVRDNDGKNLLEWAFGTYKTIRPAPQNPEPFRIWKGSENYVNVEWGAPLEFTALVERGENLEWGIEKTGTLIAPLSAGSVVGNLVISDSFGELRSVPILTVHEIEKGGFFKRLFDSIKLFFKPKKEVS